VRASIDPTAGPTQVLAVRELGASPGGRPLGGGVVREGLLEVLLGLAWVGREQRQTVLSNRDGP
jgi:hypothetical protein